MIPKNLLIIHLVIICIFIASIFGIGFGITYVSISNFNKYEQTKCYQINYIVSSYDHCYQICNTTIPDCNLLLRQYTAGPCYNASQNYDNYKSCFVQCDQYYLVNVTYEYNVMYMQNIIFDCQNNKTCINKLINTTEVQCYYDKSDPLMIITTVPNNYRWEYIIIIVILCALLILYIIINLTIFKKFNFP